VTVSSHVHVPLVEQIDALLDRLRALAPERAGSLEDERKQAIERVRDRYQARFEALARAQAAIAQLRAVTSPGEMLARAPSALCGASAFERSIISRVRGGRMIAEAAHSDAIGTDAATLVEQLRANPPRLEHPLIETELLRRRRATIVIDAQLQPRVDRRLMELTGWESYVAAPVVVGSRAVGIIHADLGQQTPGVLDRDVLWEFATGLAQAYESASLRRSLRREREQMRHFLEWLNARSGELSEAPVTLAAGRASLAPPEPLGQPLPTEGRDDRIVFEGLLTRRELDVLRLLADGQSNTAIADALVISSGTVKFHVNSILRKLHASNRAEAVFRYLRLLGMRLP
jgi:LuxR family transcriptional regulator, regulator of acetate metabolism